MMPIQEDIKQKVVKALAKVRGKSENVLSDKSLIAQDELQGVIHRVMDEMKDFKGVNIGLEQSGKDMTVGELADCFGPRKA